MKKESFVICISIVLGSTSLIFPGQPLPVNFSGIPVNLMQGDSTWRTTTIAKLAEQAPGGGDYKEFGVHGYLETGAFVFWARYGDNKRKDWALYSYKNGQTELVVKAFEKYTQDGMAKEFIPLVLDPLLSAGQSKFNFGGLGSKVIYLVDGSGSMGRYDYVYSWDGRDIKKVVGEGDKLTLPGQKEVTIKAVRLEWITNDDQALIFFVAEDKTKGWLLHDGSRLKPFFIEGDPVPGMPGVKLKGLVVGGMYNDRIFFFHDTLLVNMYIDGAPYRQAILRISKEKTDVIASPKGLNAPVLIYAAGPDNFIFRAKEIYHYKNGNQKLLLEHKKDLPGNTQFSENDIVDYAFTGPEKETTVFTTAGTWTRIFASSEGKISVLLEGPRSPDPMFKVKPYRFKTVRGLNEIFIENIFIKKEETWTQSQYVDPRGREPHLALAPEIRTDKTDRFDLSDIIAIPDQNRMFVKSTPYFGLTGLFELTR